MSSIVIAGNTSGTVTLDAPAVAGSTVLTLPNVTGTLAIQAQAVRQVVSTITGAVATGTTAIPLDNTIPQITEGDQYMSVTITPKSATSTLLISVTVHGVHTVNARWMATLFQDATANALATGACGSGTGIMGCCSYVYKMTSGTTSATTFKVRAGSLGGATFTFNGEASAALFNGTAASSIVITEVGG